MATFIKETRNTAKGVDTASANIIGVIFIEAIGKQTKEMDMVRYSSKMVMYIKATGLMVINMKIMLLM